MKVNVFIWKLSSHTRLVTIPFFMFQSGKELDMDGYRQCPICFPCYLMAEINWNVAQEPKLTEKRWIVALCQKVHSRKTCFCLQLRRQSLFYDCNFVVMRSIFELYNQWTILLTTNLYNYVMSYFWAKNKWINPTFSQKTASIFLRAQH